MDWIGIIWSFELINVFNVNDLTWMDWLNWYYSILIYWN